MTKIAVYHLRDVALRVGRDDAGRKDAATASAIVSKGVLEEKNYVYNARVKIDETGKTVDQLLEECFRLTNSVETPWVQNEEIVFSGAERQRSSMVGDIFVVMQKPYIVSSFGFTALDDKIAHELADHAPTGGAIAFW